MLHNNDDNKNSSNSTLWLRLLPAFAGLVQGQSSLSREAYTEHVIMQQRGGTNKKEGEQESFHSIEEIVISQLQVLLVGSLCSDLLQLLW